MSFLNELAEGETPSSPIIVEVIQGKSLQFRRPLDGELDAAKADAKMESEAYFKANYQPTVQQKEWLPKTRESFIRATVMSAFLDEAGITRKQARRLLCQVAMKRPVIFSQVFQNWAEAMVTAEVGGFISEVESRKNSSGKTESDSDA